MEVNSQVHCIYLFLCIIYVQEHVYLIMTLFSLSDLLTVGHSCLSDMQCTGTEFASVCNNRQCECQSRYILNGTKCYPGN